MNAIVKGNEVIEIDFLSRNNKLPSVNNTNNKKKIQC
jgi:hypothetical protein